MDTSPRSNSLKRKRTDILIPDPGMKADPSRNANGLASSSSVLAEVRPAFQVDLEDCAESIDRPGSPASSASTTMSDSSYLSSSSGDTDSDEEVEHTSETFERSQEPKTDVREQLRAFLPQLAAANADLDRRRRLGEIVDRGFELSTGDDDVNGENMTSNAARKRGNKRALVEEHASPQAASEPEPNIEHQSISGAHEAESDSTSEAGDEEQGQYIEMNLGLGVLEEQASGSSSAESTSDEEGLGEAPSLRNLLSLKGDKKSSINNRQGIPEMP